MVAGLILQAAGLGWLAVVAVPGVSYGTLVAPLVIAGAGIAMCFPTVANEVTGSVPPEDVGLAVEADGRTIREARVAVGGVATVPWRLRAVERALAGQPLNEAAIREASSAAADGAKTTEHNAHKARLLPRRFS